MHAGNVSLYNLNIANTYGKVRGYGARSRPFRPILNFLPPRGFTFVGIWPHASFARLLPGSCLHRTSNRYAGVIPWKFIRRLRTESRCRRRPLPSVFKMANLALMVSRSQATSKRSLAHSNFNQKRNIRRNTFRDTVLANVGTYVAASLLTEPQATNDQRNIYISFGF